MLQVAQAINPDSLLEKNDFLSRFWKDVFLKAEEKNASDIHAESLVNQGFCVRFRVDGILQTIYPTDSSKKIFEATDFIDKLKQIANLSLLEKKRMLDSRFSLSLTESSYRACLTPGLEGQNIVLRVIRQANTPSLSDLNLPEETLKDIRSSALKAKGLFLITGPTGSGKSTTLSSIINDCVDAKTEKVISIEDPVERTLDYVQHEPVSKDFPFNDAIRSALRQDPDVILVGEIRDEESCGLALKAASTGHLVFSTLHTNSAIGTISRLLMLAEPYQFAESVLFIGAQRLFPKLCTHCRLKKDDLYYREKKGCEHCSFGIKGRQAVLEYLCDLDPEDIYLFQKNSKALEEKVKNKILDQIFALSEQGILCSSLRENYV